MSAMPTITVPLELELTARSRALIEALSNCTAEQAAAPTAAPARTTPPALGSYWPGQGGIYCGVLPAIGDQPAQHMVFSVEEANLKWGPYDNDVPGAKSRHNGRANTATLLAAQGSGGKEYPAANWAAAREADGHRDFHLPSQAELFMASLHAPQVFKKDGWYWSSTQRSPRFAFVQDFEYGYSYWYYKDYEYRVRAVRWIQL